MNPILGILLILAATAAMVLVVHGVWRWLGVSGETSRKILHAAMGLLLSVCPWLFSRAWPVWALGGVYIALLAGKSCCSWLRKPIQPIMCAIERRTLGEFCFAVVVPILFWLSGADPLAFCAPMLILALADAAAAVIGCRYGVIRYRLAGGAKSLEGSLAFCVVTFLILDVAVAAAAEQPRLAGVYIAANIAVVLTLIEAACWYGLDNLLIPLAAFALLRALPGWSAITLQWSAACSVAALAGAAVMLILRESRRVQPSAQT